MGGVEPWYREARGRAVVEGGTLGCFVGSMGPFVHLISGRFREGSRFFAAVMWVCGVLSRDHDFFFVYVYFYFFPASEVFSVVIATFLSADSILFRPASQFCLDRPRLPGFSVGSKLLQRR